MGNKSKVTVDEMLAEGVGSRVYRVTPERFVRMHRQATKLLAAVDRDEALPYTAVHQLETMQRRLAYWARFVESSQGDE
jgi:hypothetical protein